MKLFTCIPTTHGSSLHIKLLLAIALLISAMPANGQSDTRVKPDAVSHMKALVARRLNMISLPNDNAELAKLSNPTMEQVKKAIPEKYTRSRQLCDKISGLRSNFSTADEAKTYFSTTIFDGSTPLINDFFSKPGRNKAEARKKVEADIARYIKSAGNITESTAPEKVESNDEKAAETPQSADEAKPEKPTTDSGTKAASKKAVQPQPSDENYDYRPTDGAATFGVIVFIIIVLLLLSGCAYLWLELQKAKAEISRLKHESTRHSESDND